MERSLKERLIGATVLVALAVWLIPWVLTGPVSTVGVNSTEGLALPVVQNFEETRTQIINLDENREPPISSSGNSVANGINQLAESTRLDVAPQPGSQISNENSFQEETSILAEQEQLVSQVSGENTWVVQVGSFGELENAQRQVQRVATFGFEASVSSFSTSDRTMFRVRIGPASTRVDAEGVASSLVIHGFVPQVVSQD